MSENKGSGAKCVTQIKENIWEMIPQILEFAYFKS